MPNNQKPIYILCNPQDQSKWKESFSFYNVCFASPKNPLGNQLLQAAEHNASLFVIIDNTKVSDEQLIGALNTYYAAAHSLLVDKRGSSPSKETAPGKAMRIVFVADRSREIPSPLFRVLANFDIFDIIVPPKGNVLEFSPYVEVARVLSQPKSYSDIVEFIAGDIENPKLVGLSAGHSLSEKSRPQTRIAIARNDLHRGRATHTSLLLARTLVCLGYKVALFIDIETWKQLRRCYPRARCSVTNGLITLSGIDFYRNEGFARANGYDYVLADFGCALWIDLKPGDRARALEENFQTAQLAILTSVVSPLGDHYSFERVLKVWEKTGKLQNLSGVKFAFFGMPHQDVFENWTQAAQMLNSKAELYNLPYLPDPLRYEPKEGHCPELIALLSSVLRAKDK